MINKKNSFLLSHVEKHWLSYLLGFAGIYFISIRGQYTLLDLLDLFLHEAGHFFFSIFGQFIHSLGGTLMQILLPLICAFIFFINGRKYMTQIFLFWLGHNFINISVYVDDANKMKLKIIGGSHDWNWILNQLDLIEYSTEIGYGFLALSILAFLTMFFVPYFIHDNETTRD